MRRGPRGGYQGGGGSGGSSTPTCKFYAQGYCSKGADCKFAHVDDDPPQRQSQGRGGGGGGGSRVCKYFLESRCTHGVNCRFEHPGAGQARTNVNVPNNGGALPNNRGGTAQRLYFEHRDPKQQPYQIFKDGVEYDLGDKKKRELWGFSCYAPGLDAPKQLFGGTYAISPELTNVPIEWSFEEVALLFYNAVQEDKAESQAMNAPVHRRTTDLIHKFDLLDKKVDDLIRQAAGNINEALDFVLRGANEHPNRIDEARAASQGNVPPNTLPPAAGWGGPSTLSINNQTSAFGIQPTFGQPSTFGKPSSQPTSFGRPSSLPGVSQAVAQPPQQSPFAASGRFMRAMHEAGKSNVLAPPPAPETNFQSFMDGTQAQQSTQQPQQASTAFGQPSPFAPSSQASASGFGQPSTNQQTNMNGFGNAPSPFAPSNQASASGFGQPSTHQQANSNGFGNTPQTNNNASHSRPSPAGMRVLRDPDTGASCYRRPDGKLERIWMPDGPPQAKNVYAEGPLEAYQGERGDALKHAYDYVRETGEFEDGVMPEMPPMQEDIDFNI